MSVAIAIGYTISKPTSSFERRRICRSFSRSQRTALMPLTLQEADERLLEILALGGLRSRLQRGRRAVEQQLAVGQHEDPIAVAFGLGDVVRAEHHARPAVGQPLDEAPQPLTLTRIQRRRRL